MSGFYANWVKVQHPNKIFHQMTSDCYQPPFYFGGSQVPETMGTNLHESKHKTEHRMAQKDVKEIRGAGIPSTTVAKNNNIRLPRALSSVRKYY